MSGSTFLSSNWHRVAGLRPKLRDHVSVSRHRYRRQSWYVLHDHATGGVHRVSPASYRLIGAMDGRHSLDELWQQAAIRLGEESPSQDEFIQLLGQLHTADLLQTDVTPDAAALLERANKTRRSLLLRNLINPLVFKKSLWYPDRFFERTLPLVDWLFNWYVAAIWFVVVACGFGLAALNWTPLTHNAVDRVLAADNILLIVLSYPLLKALHELGHGFTLKHYGGAVHEIGVMFLVFFPMPYVDASDAAKFRNKWQRALVGAAGMVVEVFVAALAMFVWTLVEPGLVQAIAFNVMLIAGVSTLLFNGNPLLRFDGYYILADVLEIPNLAQRATRYWRYLVDRYLFATDGVKEFEAARGERPWLFAYAPTSYLYKVSIVMAIAIFVAGQYLAVGIAIAIWSLSINIILPVAKAVWQALTSPRYNHNRARVIATTSTLVATSAGFLLLVPMPLHTNAEGVVWLPERAQIRAGADGFVTRLVAAPDRQVAPGDVLLASTEPALRTRLDILRERVVELEVRLAAQRFKDRAEAKITLTELAQARSELALRRQQNDRLAVISPASGIYNVLRPQDLPGRYLKEGELIGYVLPSHARVIRATVAQDDIALVREHLRHVSVRLAEHLDLTLPARVIREVPAGSDELPSKALGGAGGGAFPVKPGDERGTKTFQRVFQLDIELTSAELPATAFGSRAYVRFDHDWEPVGHQLWRRLRQLLLSRLEI